MRVLWLLGSNALATTVLALGTFFVARLVTPKEFGAYSLASQFAVSIYPLLTLRYEQALPVHGNRPASNLLLLGCILLAGVSTLLLTFLAALARLIPAVSMRLPADVVDLLPLVVLGALSLALSSIFQSAALTRGALKGLALTRLVRALILVGLQCGFAITLGASAVWLYIGEVSANLLHTVALTSVVGIGACFNLSRRRRKWKSMWRGIRAFCIRYKDFPLITLPHAFVHSALGLGFAFLFSALYGAAALGQYYLMRKLVFGVLAIFNVAVNQNAVAEAANSPRNHLLGISVRASLLMGSVAIASAIVLAVFGPDLIVMAVGENWRDAGLMAAACFTLIIFEPMTSTLAFIPVFLRLQHVAFGVAVMQGLTGIGSLAVAKWIGLGAVQAMFLSSVAVSIVMVCYIVWMLSKVSKERVRNEAE